MPDLGPSALAAVVALAASGFVAWLNHRLGLDTATSRYISSLEGLVKARDAEIVALNTRIGDLETEDRRKDNIIRALEARITALEKR